MARACFFDFRFLGSLRGAVCRLRRRGHDDDPGTATTQRRRPGRCGAQRPAVFLADIGRRGDWYWGRVSRYSVGRCSCCRFNAFSPVVNRRRVSSLELRHVGALIGGRLSTDGSFGNAIAEGLFRSWQLKMQIWKPVAAQLLLLGLITFVHVNYVEQGSAAGPGPFAAQDKTNWTVNAFWIGGYEDECRWYGAYVDALHTTPVELITLALGLVFAVLAICVKLNIAKFVVAAPTAAMPPEPWQRRTRSSPQGEGKKNALIRPIPTVRISRMGRNANQPLVFANGQS